MATIFTLGYQRRSIDEFVRILRGEAIDVLIDVRETAWSHKPGFSKTALSTALARVGVEYVHARFAGNPKRLRDRAPTHEACLQAYARHVDENVEIIANLDRLLDELLAAGKRVCMTCFERHPDDCHRSILANRWQQRGRRRVEHLATDGCERLIASG